MLQMIRVFFVVAIVALGFVMATPEARPAEGRESVSVATCRSSRMAYLIVRNPAADGDATDFTIFAEAEGRHLIDDVVFLSPEEAATPAP